MLLWISLLNEMEFSMPVGKKIFMNMKQLYLG